MVKTNPLFFVIMFLIAIAMSGAADARGAKQLTPDIQARLMALKEIRGGPVDKSTFDGKPVLVTFFASWCPPCLAEMRDIKAFIGREGTDKINIIAVNWIEELTGLSPSRLNRFLREVHPSIKVVEGTPEVSRDFGTVFSIPAAFIYDGKGKQVFSLGGGRGGHGRHYLNGSQLEAVLKKIN